MLAPLRLAVVAPLRAAGLRGLEWADIDTAAALAVIPPERMNGRCEHRLPLSRQALALLEDEFRRLLREATSEPVLFDGPDETELVLLPMDMFVQLTDPVRTRSMRADELTARNLELLRTAPLPPDSPKFADDEDLIWHG